jgi:hypothetical protein
MLDYSQRNKARLYFFIFLASFFLGLLSKLLYREFVLKNNISDFGFADAAPNLFFTIGFSALLLAFDENIYYIIAVVAASIFYEIDQAFDLVRIFWSPGTFDIKDIFATIAGGLIIFLVVRIRRPNT